MRTENEYFLQLKQLIGKEENLARHLALKLDISFQSAYKKIKGKASMSWDEARFVMNEAVRNYGPDGDEIVLHRTTNFNPCTEAYFELLKNQILPLSKLKGPIFWFCSDFNPIFFIQNPLWLSFWLFYEKRIKAKESFAPFGFQEDKDEVSEFAQKLSELRQIFIRLHKTLIMDLGIFRNPVRMLHYAKLNHWISDRQYQELHRQLTIILHEQILHFDRKTGYYQILTSEHSPIHNIIFDSQSGFGYLNPFQFDTIELQKSNSTRILLDHYLAKLPNLSQYDQNLRIKSKLIEIPEKTRLWLENLDKQ